MLVLCGWGQESRWDMEIMFGEVCVGNDKKRSPYMTLLRSNFFGYFYKNRGFLHGILKNLSLLT